MSLLRILIIIIVTTTAVHAEEHWGYQGDHGPEHWGNLKKEFTTCKTGQKQSPIDLKGAKSADLAKHNMHFRYRTSRMNVINNGHTIQVNYDKGSSVRIGEKTYDLLQFHFHTPSEHTVSSKTTPMEVHFVHKAADGELAVVGVMMKKGAEHPVIESLWRNLPATTGKEQTVKDQWLNAFNLLPAGKAHYNYEGSLTTPPCSEGVNWNVMHASIEVSEAQIKKFRELFPVNARPVQSLQDRTLSSY